MRNPLKRIETLEKELQVTRSVLDVLRMALSDQGIKIHQRQIDAFFESPSVATDMSVRSRLAELEDKLNARMDDMGKKLGLVYVKASEVKLPARWESEDA